MTGFRYLQKNIESRFYFGTIKVLFPVTLMALTILLLDVMFRTLEEFLEDNYPIGKTDELRTT